MSWAQRTLTASAEGKYIFNEGAAVSTGEGCLGAAAVSEESFHSRSDFRCRVDAADDETGDLALDVDIVEAYAAAILNRAWRSRRFNRRSPPLPGAGDFHRQTNLKRLSSHCQANEITTEVTDQMRDRIGDRNVICTIRTCT